jgi:hypothetical protein
MDELGERPNIEGLVDIDDAAYRVGGGVDACQGGAHGVADHHRRFDAQLAQEAVEC